MRLTGIRGRLRLGTCLVALMAVAGAASAREADSDDNEEIEEVVVTGIRSSIKRAQDIKRSADSVVDAISATGLGRFADTSLADAFQRIPGVQIQRNDGGQEGDRASIRGLGPTFVVTTINGRTPLSSGTEGLTNLRSFNLEVIPTSVITGAIVKKTPEAKDVESGLAGAVDIQTRKPLDSGNYKNFENFFGAFTFQGDRGSIGRDVGYRGSAIIGGKNEDDTLGYYVSALYGESFPGRDQLFPQVFGRDINIDNDGDGVADEVVEDVLAVNDIDFEPIREEQDRVSVAGAVQWRPNDKLEINLEGVYTFFDNVSVRNRVAPVFGPAIDATVFNPNDLVIDSTNTLQSVAPGALSPDSAVTVVFIPFLFGNQTETTVTGLNLAYEPTDTFRFKIDASYNRVDYTQDLDLPIFLQDVPGNQVSFNTNNGFFSADLGNIPLDGFGFPPGLALVRDVFLNGDELGFRADFENDFVDGGILESIEYGVRWTRAEVDSIRTNILDVAQAGLTPEQLDDFADQIIDQNETTDFNGFFGGDTLSPNFPIGSLDTAIDLIPALGEVNDLGVDPASSFFFTEDVIAFYAQTNLRGDLGDTPFSGNIGLRVVNAQVAGEGQAVQPDASTLPTSATDDYWEFLPSANFNFFLRDDLALRLGVSRVLSRPNPSDLVPREGANQPSSPGDIPTGRLGNPFLDPTTSWNFDATFEYYTPNDGSFTASVFYKEVSNFIFTVATQGLIPGQGDQLFAIQEPQNFSDGNVFGFEVGFNQPFTFLPEPLDGFGLQANYTFVDSSVDEEVGDGGFGFPGASQNNINAILYYEKGPVGVRVAYVFRDDFFRNLPGQGAQQENASALFTEGNSRVNINATYDITENFSIFFDVNNLFATDRRDFLFQRETFNGGFDREATITFGITGAF